VFRLVSKLSEIAFIGPAGVGKRTQILLLKDYLHQRGYKVSHRYVKSFHSRFLGYIGRLAGRGGDSTTIDLLFAKRLMRFLSIVDLFMVLGTYLYTVKFSQMLGKLVLTEESLLGTITEFMDAERKRFISRSTESRILKFILRIIKNQKPLVIAMTADLATLHDRMRRRGYRHEKDPFLMFQIEAVREVSQLIDKRCLIFLETEQYNILQTHKVIVSRLSPFLDCQQNCNEN
jgi:hypothetical protein